MAGKVLRLSTFVQLQSVCLKPNRCGHFLPVAALKTMAKKPEAVLIDLSGTLHIDDTVIEGSQTALERLRKTSLKLRFVTNTTKEPLRMLHEKLTKLGFNIEKDEIFTSLTAARRLIETRQLRPFLMVEEVAKEDFTDIETNDPNAVVIGLAPDCFNYQNMDQAFRLLLGGSPLIAIHKARYYKKSDGLLHLGPGAFVSGLEYATDTEAHVVGKPQKSFFMEAIKDLGVDAENSVMIGDDARDDVNGAMKAGFMGVLVKSGKYQPGDEEKVSPAPTATCEDFPAAVDYILSLL